MPTYQLTSPRTGRTYGVQATAELPDDDIDALVNDLDFEAAREAGVQPGVDPAVLQQGPVGTFFGSFPNTFSKIGSETIGGVGRMLDKASESLSQATGLPKGGDMFQRMADYGDELSSSADITFPKNPLNPVAGALGSGAAQGLSLLAGGLAGKALTGSNVAMTAVPAASGFLSGANQGIQTAEEIGVQSPLAQLGTGMAFGGLEVLTERLGGIGSKAGTEALTRAVRQTAGQMLRSSGRAVGSEALEEVLAGRSQAALTRLIASEDPNNPGFTRTGVNLDALAREIVNLEAMKLEALGGAAGGTVFAGVQALANRQLPNDPTTSPNQTPAPTQPPAPGQPGEPAPMGAGAPGAAAVSPLIGIAQRGGAVDVTLPDDTGELTAEEVADLEMTNEEGRMTNAVRQPILQGVPDRPQRTARFQESSLNEEPIMEGDAITDLRIPRSPEAIAESQRIEAERQQQIATMRMLDARAQGMPLIPDSPSGSRDILDFANENPIYLPPGFSEERNLPEYEKLKEAKLPPYWRQFVASSKRGGNPSDVAQRAFDAGFIDAPTADAYLEAVRGGIEGRQQYRVQFAQRDKALQQEEERVVNFEQSQDKLARKRSTERVDFEDIRVGDAMTIDGEPAVVRNIEYDEDGYLTNVVIEDGKRFGLMQFDPQTRGGILVDEFQPRAQRSQEPVPLMLPSNRLGRGLAEMMPGQVPGSRFQVSGSETVPTPGAGAIRPQPGASRVTAEGSIPSTAPSARAAQWWASTSRAEAQAILEPASLEELKAIAVRMDENPNQPKAKLINRLVQITGVYSDALGIRGADAVGPRGPMPDYTGRTAEAQQRMREQKAARAQQPKEQGLPKKAKPRTPEEFARDMAALMTTPGRQTVGTMQNSADLATAYTTAARGQSSQMIPLAEVFAVAQAADPALTPAQFQAQVMAEYDAGRVLLEGAGSPQEAQSAGLRIDNTPVGTAVRMAVTGTSPSLPVSQSPSLESPASLAANQSANEAILRKLGLPTAKGSRTWGGKKIQGALRKLAQDERYPATTRRMAQELAARPLDNLLLKIEADARLNWAGLYQPFNNGRGELSLNTRTMGRGELDIGISLVHEVLHHATYQALRNPKTAAQKQAAKDLQALYARAKAALAANEQLSQFDYELSNLDEFITGLWTRADFQTALAGIPADAAPTLGQRVRSMLDEIFRVLSELVTGKAVPPGSVLEASMAATLRIMEDGRTEVEFGANAGDPLQNPASRLAARVLPLHERGEPFRVKQLGARAILTGSPLPADVTQVLAMTENERQAVAQSAAQVGNDLQAAVKAYLDRTGQDERVTWDKINAVMGGQPGALTLLTAIDPALGERSRRARNMLDDLSAAVAQTLPTGSLRDAITQNQGSWMRRGYAAFDPESGWNFDGLTKAAKAGRQIGGKDAAKILANARAYLRSQNPQNGRTLKEWNADIEADMRDLMDRNAWQSANLGGNTLRKNVSSFMRRKEIAPEIRALMGEETNPLHRFIKSAAFQAQIVARHHGQTAVRALGLQTELFSTQRGGVYTEEIEPSENRWSGLAGVWTTPEMKAALANSSAVNREGTDLGGWLVGTVKALGNEAKLNRVALNPDSWVVNILGNVVGLVQSGDVFAWDFARRLTDARALIKSGKARPGSMQTAAESALIDAQRAMLARLRGMGVLGSSITLADIEASIPRHLLQWVAEDRARNTGLGAVKGAIMGQAAGRGLGLPGRVVGGVAGGIGGAIAGAQRLQNWQQNVADYVMTGPDALARVTGWLTNYETALAAGQNPDQAAADATTRTLNTFPNYNALPALLRQLSRLGFTGSFIAFQWEVYRNFGWNVKYAIEELSSGNAAIQARGMRRLAGIGSVAALAGGGLAALLGAAGAAASDDEERNKIWRQWFAAPWEKDAVLAFDKYDKEGVSYYNTSYLLPQMTMMELIQGASEGRDPADSASRVVNRLSEQFIAGSVHLQPLLAAFANQDRFGRRITNAEGLEGAAQRADVAAQVILEPGFADKITRLNYALRGAEKNGRKFSVEEEMKRLAGIRQVSRTWEELVKRRYSQFTYDYQGVRDDANKILGENLPGAPVRAVKMVNDKVIELQQQMADYERDLRRLGVPEPTIKAAKKDSSLQRLNPVRVRADGRRVESVTVR